MILVVLFLFPLIAGCLSFFSKEIFAKIIAISASLAVIAISIFLMPQAAGGVTFQLNWLPDLGAHFSLFADTLSLSLIFLTGIVFLATQLFFWKRGTINMAQFVGFMLLSMAGLIGVFLAHDALLFYFFWELALIPVYFLCSTWGGEKRIAVTFKFFIYTFIGSLMMLIGLVYIHNSSLNHSFDWANMINAGKSLPLSTQKGLFWLFFMAFAIKMPVFPFHTWQPDTYEQSPTSVTIILSALMVKMGIYGIIRWLLPLLPDGVLFWKDLTIWLCIIGIVYASLLAIRQTNLKRLIAYSSIAHIGLIAAVVFAQNQIGLHGVLIQMFNHGINIAAMWLMISFIENRYQTVEISKLSGIAINAPRMMIAFLIISLANIALPLTNGFVGEFLLFNGLFQAESQYAIIWTVLAGLGVIFGAIYTLNMIRKVAYGENGVPNSQIKDITMNEFCGIMLLGVFIIVLGIYPQPILAFTSNFIGH